jgi:MoaA/NifB/PqqE/SkfB family radical SAM enzyme
LTRPELEKIAKTLDQFRFPRKITFEVCSECNLECVMCYQPNLARPKGVMTFDVWRKCADEIAEESPGTECWFSFCGEPLLEPERLCRMLAYGKSAGLDSLNVNTNGVLLTPELSDLILDTGVDVVVFGVDGFSRPTYESIRVGGDRDVVYANIEYLLSARDRRPGRQTDVQVQFIEMDENEHELDIFRRYWLEKGAVVKVRKKLSWGGRIDTPLAVPEEMRIPCPWVINLMHVCWDGQVPRCPGDTDGVDSVGNVWDESLRELWSRLSPHRQLHLDHRFGELPEDCRRCKDWMTGAAERHRPRPDLCDLTNGTLPPTKPEV